MSMTTQKREVSSWSLRSAGTVQVGILEAHSSSSLRIDNELESNKYTLSW